MRIFLKIIQGKMTVEMGAMKLKRRVPALRVNYVVTDQTAQTFPVPVSLQNGGVMMMESGIAPTVNCITTTKSSRIPRIFYRLHFLSSGSDQANCTVTVHKPRKSGIKHHRSAKGASLKKLMKLTESEKKLAAQKQKKLIQKAKRF